MLVKGVSLLQSGNLIKDRDILIEGNRISRIGRDLKDEDVINGRGKLAIPGLVNGHTHTAMTLLRGYADDMELKPWLEEKIWPLEGRLTPEDAYWGTKLGCLEQIRLGVTCYNDMYHFPDAVAEATKEMGLRALISGVIFDMKPEYLKDVEPFIKRWKDEELISPAVGPHSIYACSEETLLKLKDISDRYDSTVHIHLSETREEVEGSQSTRKMSPVEYLDSLGMLNSRLIAAHCVWLSENDCNLMAKKKANVASCSVSNLKLTSGIAPLSNLLGAGANVCLGTDGPASNNNLSMFEEMKVTSIIQKNACHAPAAFSAETIWNMATRNAYNAVRLNMGLREGALADLALIDLRKPWFCPETNMTSHLIYSMTGGVDTTIVNGKVLMKNGVVPGEEEILDETQKRFEKLTAGL